MRKPFCFIIVIALVFLISCQRYIGSIEVPKGAKIIGIVNPIINLKVTEHTKSTGTIILNKKKIVRSIPKELLTESEKEFLDRLIDNTVSIFKEKLSSEFIEIESPQLKSDFINIIDEININQIHSNGLMPRNQIFNKLPNKKDKLLTYIIISDINTQTLKPSINNKSGEHKLIVKKAKYDNFNVINETKNETLVKINNYNFLYTKNNQSGLNTENKIIEACSKNNLDALITVNLNYQFEKTTDLLSLDYKWRIRLRGEINIYNNKGVLVNENTLTGKSNYLKITKSEFNKISTATQFVYNLDNLESENTIVEIFEVLPRTEYSFSLQNIFGSLYIEATEDFLIKLTMLD